MVLEIILKNYTEWHFIPKKKKNRKNLLRTPPQLFEIILAVVPLKSSFDEIFFSFYQEAIQYSFSG
jgi:hypothetical protein